MRVQIKMFKNLKPVKYCLFHIKCDPAKIILEELNQRIGEEKDKNPIFDNILIFKERNTSFQS